jgi:nanoRNase/pAp phosphatase (c-di-AMP/oligoRNAs hydrolase)
VAKRAGEEKKAIAVFMHRHADLDTLCSSFVVHQEFKKYNIESYVVMQDCMNVPAKCYAEHLGITVFDRNTIDWERVGYIALVDSAVEEMFPLLKESIVKDKEIALIIDHHQQKDGMLKGWREIKDHNARATAEILALGIEELNEKEAEALAIAIISDSAHFRTGTSRTFYALCRCLDICKTSYEELLTHAFPEKSPEDKEIILNAFKTMDVKRINDVVVAFIETKKNESDVSSIVVDVADISFALKWDEENGLTRISARARQHVPIFLNKLMQTCGERTGGQGGGHTKAAGAFMRCSIEESKQIIFEELVKYLKE